MLLVAMLIKDVSLQTHLADTDTESGSVKDIREKKIPQPLLLVPSAIPSSDDLHLRVGRAHTPATVDPECEPEVAPSKIEDFNGFHRTTNPDHPLTQVSPTPTPTRVSYHRRTHRYRSYYETPSPSSSPTLPIRKRHRGTSELVEDTKDESSDSDAEREGADDEGHG
ncbi:hypothetical protein Tco_1139210 [Tanacetum coccineum]